MHQSNSRYDHDTRRQVITVEFYWGSEFSAHVEHHGPDPRVKISPYRRRQAATAVGPNLINTAV